jgi:hypothetical protein
MPNVAWSWRFASPAGKDVSRAAELGLNFHKDPPFAISWCLDERGNPIDGTLRGSTYVDARPRDASLPTIEAYRLEDSPPRR